MEMYNRFKKINPEFDSVATVMREGFMAAAADWEEIRLEMREGFRLAAERDQAFQNQTEASFTEIIRIISAFGNMINVKIDANHQEMKTFQKSTIEALESINHSLKRLANLEKRN